MLVNAYLLALSCLADGLYLIEVDRVLRPGGYWVLSGPPINWRKHYKGWQRTKRELRAENDAIENLAARMCWEKVGEKGDLAVWRKPINHLECKENKKRGHMSNTPAFCPADQNPDSAWYFVLPCLSWWLVRALNLDDGWSLVWLKVRKQAAVEFWAPRHHARLLLCIL